MERKLATVLFVDLVSATELVAGQDPEVIAAAATARELLLGRSWPS
jgi:class 3 adenylate cyclase